MVHRRPIWQGCRVRLGWLVGRRWILIIVGWMRCAWWCFTHLMVSWLWGASSHNPITFKWRRLIRSWCTKCYGTAQACLSVHCRSFSPWSTAASCHRISRQVVAGSTAIIIIFYEHHHRFLSLLLEQCGFFLFGVMGGRNYVDRRPDVENCIR